MTHTTTSTIRTFVPRDRFRTNAEPIARLYATMGETGAEQTICAALDDLALRLQYVELSLADCRFDEVSQHCRRMSAVAEQIGLTEVAIAADHLFTSANVCGGHVGAALMARLSRATDRAIGEVWNMRGARP